MVIENCMGFFNDACHGTSEAPACMSYLFRESLASLPSRPSQLLAAEGTEKLRGLQGTTIDNIIISS
jgi:hypothetical protein